MFSQQVPGIPRSEERGAMLIEYATLFAVVVIAAIVALSAFGVSVVDLYTSNSDQYTGAVQRNVG